MTKKLLLPIVIGLTVGLGSGSGYAYKRSVAKFVLDSARFADSLSVHVSDSTGIHADRGLPASDGLASTTDDKGQSQTIDSIIPAAPLSHGERQAAENSETGKPAPPHSGKTEQGVAAQPASTGPGDAAQAGDKGITADAAQVVKNARDAALKVPLPEQRLAKIFAAMPAKEAAKVLDQMTDADVRQILYLMNDRQAAAILSQLPTGRAAAVTRGAMSGETPP